MSRRIQRKSLSVQMTIFWCLFQLLSCFATFGTECSRATGTIIYSHSFIYTLIMCVASCCYKVSFSITDCLFPLFLVSVKKKHLHPNAQKVAEQVREGMGMGMGWWKGKGFVTNLTISIYFALCRVHAMQYIYVYMWHRVSV